METLQSLRRRLDSTQDLQTVVKTMKAIAAVSINQYDRAVSSLVEYRKAIHDGFHALLCGDSRLLDSMRGLEYEGTGAVVFGASQGMSGRFDDVIADFSAERLGGPDSKNGRPKAIVLGRKAADILRERDLDLSATIDLPGSVHGITEAVVEILMVIERWRREDENMRIFLFYNRKSSGTSFEPGRRTLFPLDVEMLEGIAGRRWSSPSLPFHRLDYTTLLGRLLYQHFFVSLYEAFAQSLAAENASRLAAMQAAESNIEEKLEELEATYNHRRQDSITSELLDIASGYEALQHSSKR